MEAASRRRILFVDDEPGIRLTLPPILEMHGFEVITAATVADALDIITKNKFDVLLADLNIGQPGDGFTVVSAMRRTHPSAVNIIITGYPAFETALEAIRRQVDDYVVKPANIPGLLKVIETHLQQPTRHEPVPQRRLAELLRNRLDEIMGEWLEAVKADEELSAIHITDGERVDHLPAILEEMVRGLEERSPEWSRQAGKAAEEHGRKRLAQGYTVPLLLNEAQLLRRAIIGAVQQNLLAVDMSYMMTDLAQASELIDIHVRRSIEAFLEGERKAA